MDLSKRYPECPPFDSLPIIHRHKFYYSRPDLESRINFRGFTAYQTSSHPSRPLQWDAKTELLMWDYSFSRRKTGDDVFLYPGSGRPKSTRVPSRKEIRPQCGGLTLSLSTTISNCFIKCSASDHTKYRFNQLALQVSILLVSVMWWIACGNCELFISAQP